jgi:hypothetical protein
MWVTRFWPTPCSRRRRARRNETSNSLSQTVLEMRSRLWACSSSSASCPRGNANRSSVGSRMIDEVELRGARVGERQRDARQGPAGTNACVQHQPLAEIVLRTDFGPVRIADVRQSHGAQVDRIGRRRALEVLFRKRDAGRFKEFCAGRERFEFEPDPGLTCRFFHELHRRAGDLLPDAVARQHGDAEPGMRHVRASSRNHRERRRSADPRHGAQQYEQPRGTAESCVRNGGHREPRWSAGEQRKTACADDSPMRST